MTRTGHVLHGLLAWLALALDPLAARATPLAEPNVGGSVFVGPTSPHVSSIFWNPAATGLMSGWHVLAHGSLRLDQTTIRRAPISPSNGEPDPSGTSFAPVERTPMTPGWFFGFVTDAGSDRFSVGLATYVPYAVEHIPDEPSLAYHTSGGSIYGYQTTLGLSLRASRTLYFGFGLSLVLPRLDLRFDRDVGLEECAAEPCDVEDAARAQHFELSVSQPLSELFDGLAIAFTGGILAKIEGTWYGVSFTSAAPSQTEDITRSADVEVTGYGLPAEGVSGKARVSFALPAVLHFGVRRPFAATWELLANFRWVLLSTHDDIDIRLISGELRDAGLPEWIVRYRGFQDVYSLEAGVEKQNLPGAPWRVGGRLRYETGAVKPSAISPAQIDSDKVVLLLGGELRLGTRFGITAGYSLELHVSQDVKDSAFKPSRYIACTTSGHDLDTCEDVRLGRATPTAAGDYSRLSHQFTLSLSYDVW